MDEDEEEPVPLPNVNAAILKKVQICCSSRLLSAKSFAFVVNNTWIFNPSPHDKILDQTKLKAFADNKLNVTKMIISVVNRVATIV